MKRGILYVVAAVIVVAGLAAAVPPLRQRARQVAADLKIVSADTGDVMASATYQRFAARREGVAAMKATLQSVAAAESAFVADSGRPTTMLMTQGPYAIVNDKANVGPFIEIQRDRWVAKIRNNNATMSCTLTAMVDPATLDSMKWRYHAGGPVCIGWTAESTALANAPVPTNPVQPESPPEPLRAPRHHRDWGPVNNTPPPTPYIVKNACDGEGCLRPGEWVACSGVAALREKRLDAPVAFTIPGGDTFTALAIDLHVDVPGMVVFRHAMSNPPGREGDRVDSIAFTPSDTLYLLHSLGEGDWVWWFRGQLGQGYEFWREINQDQVTNYPAAPAVLVRRPKAIHWVRARNAAGQDGWIVFDYQKLGRCLRTRG